MSFSLSDKLYANKPYEETVPILGRKITFRVLSGQEESEIARRCGASSIIELIQTKRIPTLARAITAIDDAGWKEADEIKQLLHSNPEWSLVEAVESELRKSKYTDDVLGVLFAGYNDIREKYRSELSKLKNDLNQPSPESVG